MIEEFIKEKYNLYTYTITPYDENTEYHIPVIRIKEDSVILNRFLCFTFPFIGKCRYFGEGFQKKNTSNVFLKFYERGLSAQPCPSYFLEIEATQNPLDFLKKIKNREHDEILNKGQRLLRGLPENLETLERIEDIISELINIFNIELKRDKLGDELISLLEPLKNKYIRPAINCLGNICEIMLFEKSNNDD